jgi:hypothetical protein
LFWKCIRCIQKGKYPDGSIYNHLKNKLRDYPNSRCLKTENCVSLVKSGNHVYINVNINTVCERKSIK